LTPKYILFQAPAGEYPLSSRTVRSESRIAKPSFADFMKRKHFAESFDGIKTAGEPGFLITPSSQQQLHRFDGAPKDDQDESGSILPCFFFTKFSRTFSKPPFECPLETEDQVFGAQ